MLCKNLKTKTEKCQCGDLQTLFSKKLDHKVNAKSFAALGIAIQLLDGIKATIVTLPSVEGCAAIDENTCIKKNLILANKT